MKSDLADDLRGVGNYSDDAVEADVARTDIGKIIQTMNDYDIVEDPESERYILSDGTHQYSVEIQWTDMGDEEEVAVYIQESHTGFHNEALEQGSTMNTGEILQPSEDGATFGDPSEALRQGANRAPSKRERGF
ncbi:hypothetical protein [Candidatus Nanohalobium constans]|uniref:Uncharacterized protein n=1 Tax=Candidatus Nanohalobium constans TaxID=2565781 RepID=A0A5Q0UFC9_9ARCH|nr:hypothetical protein [Candidatus Nanohalobium constans]QGA80287.1 hypothetical protein LC1Nh_0386 [Candidatus Nanohalobium constans]